MTLQVGQKLWFVPRDRRSGAPCEVTVEKIGRKWARIGRARVDLDTLVVDGGIYLSPGRCYEDRAAYEAKAARDVALSELRQKINQMTPPDSVTVDAIRAASAAIFPAVR